MVAWVWRLLVAIGWYNMGERLGKIEVKQKKGGVVHLLLSRGHCIAFWPSIPPLQVAPSFACSVASLSRSPGHQLPGCHSLHCGILTDYQLGWGRPSTWFTRHADAPSRSNTLFPKGDRRMDTPSTSNRSSCLGCRTIAVSHFLFSFDCQLIIYMYVCFNTYQPLCVYLPFSFCFLPFHFSNTAYCLLAALRSE